MRFGRVYESGYPHTFGTVLTMEDAFGAELAFNGLGGGGATGSGDLRFRTHSDWSTSEWGEWRTVIDSANYTSYAAPASHSHSYLPLSGGTLSGDMHVYAHTWCGYGTGSSTINSDVYAMYVGTNGTRTTSSGTYYGGIAFSHMIKYSGGYEYCNSPQAWIGLKIYDTPGSERSSLVFATKPGTGTSNSGNDIPIERMNITPDGTVNVLGTLNVSGTINGSCSGSAGSVSWSNVTGKPFNWSGQSGQPTWLWGSNDGTNYYVWNPSNFNVSYANSANYANSAGSAPANGGNSSTVNGHTVNSDVPAGAVFTDTNTWRPLGTGANDACAGNDARLSNARPASDVYAWAKSSSKPSYTPPEVGIYVRYVTTATDDVYLTPSSSITGAANSGKMETVVVQSTSDDLYVYVTSGDIKCPGDQDIELEIYSGSGYYVEVNFLNINGTIFARGGGMG